LTDDAGGFALGMQDEKAFDGFFIAGLFLGASTTQRDLINTRSLEHFKFCRRPQRRQRSLPALQRTAQCD
jgi:hypothetical protein